MTSLPIVNLPKIDTMGYLDNTRYQYKINDNREYNMASKNEKTLEHLYYVAKPYNNKELAYKKKVSFNKKV